jgi:hypothetical protein
MSLLKRLDRCFGVFAEGSVDALRIEAFVLRDN